MTISDRHSCIETQQKGLVRFDDFDDFDFAQIYTPGSTNICLWKIIHFVHVFHHFLSEKKGLFPWPYVS